MTDLLLEDTPGCRVIYSKSQIHLSKLLQIEPLSGRLTDAPGEMSLSVF